MTTTWDPSNCSTHITLSNGNLTGTDDGTNGVSVQAVGATMTGKRYFECAGNQATSATISLIIIGVGPQITNFDFYFNLAGTQGCGINASRNSWGVHDSGTLITSGTLTFGDHTLMAAIDVPNNLFYGGVDGTWLLGDPNTGTGGHTLAHAFAFPEMSMESVGHGIANFGAQPFAFTVPAGYQGFDPLAPFGYASNPHRM